MFLVLYERYRFKSTSLILNIFNLAAYRCALQVLPTSSIFLTINYMFVWVECLIYLCQEMEYFGPTLYCIFDNLLKIYMKSNISLLTFIITKSGIINKCSSHNASQLLFLIYVAAKQSCRFASGLFESYSVYQYIRALNAFFKSAFKAFESNQIILVVKIRIKYRF